MLNRMLSFVLAAFILVIVACGGGAPEKKAAAPPPKKPAVADQSHRFPAADRVETQIVQDHLFGHDFLPGGNVARYRKGKTEYEMFLIRTSVPEAAALLLINYKNKLENPKLIPHFGGYYGKDGGRMVFVFAKGPWLAGVAGLPEKDADIAARELAARLN
jgi:hypothetical protein